MDFPTSIDFCSISELKKKKRVTKWVSEWRDELSAFYIDGKIYVLSTVCPHFGGEFEFVPGKRRLRCKWHGWDFEIESGKCLDFSIPGGLRHYPYAERENHLEVSFP